MFFEVEGARANARALLKDPKPVELRKVEA